MRRKIGVLLAVFALVAVASGCSLREVQLWFAINRKQNISAEQAFNIANLVNSKKAAGGCDGNYQGVLPGDCVPDNASLAHCASDSGFGPSIRGPLTILGWDSFGLDPDGDKKVCDSPVGGLDHFGQQIGAIGILGWGFDPDTATSRVLGQTAVGPDKVLIVENGGDGVAIDITEPRADVAGAFPGIGANHGFELGRGADIGETTQICVYLVNTGSGSTKQLKCKTITIQNGGADVLREGQPNEVGIFGLIELADRVPGGVHVRGWSIHDDGTTGIGDTVIRGAAGPSDRIAASTVQTVRNDVNAAYGLPEGTYSGFDVVIPDSKLAGSGSICVWSWEGVAGTFDQLMCRGIDT